MNRSQYSKNLLILFIIWPFLAVIRSLFSGAKISRAAKNVLWMFVAFYGYTFVLIDDSIDANRYGEALEFQYSYVHTFDQFLNYHFGGENITTDIVEPLLTWSVSRFTDNISILFLVYGIFFGYFFSRNISLIQEFVQSEKGLLIGAAFLTLMLIIPIWQLNGFRFWTAGHIYIYGVFQFLFHKKRLKSLLFIVLSIAVHLTFVMPVFVYLVYMALGARFYRLYVASFLISLLSISFTAEQMQNVLSFLPGALQERYGSYAGEAYVESVSGTKDTRNWYVIYYGLFLRYFLTALLTYVALFRHRIIRENSYTAFRLLCLCLILYAFANISGKLPSGGRFFAIANFLLLSTLIYLHYLRIPALRVSRPLMMTALGVFAFFGIVSIRIWFDSATLMTFLGNPVLAAIFKDLPAVITHFK